MSLNITDVTVEDKVDLLARTCNLTLTPESKENPPVAEFRFPGDSATLTGTSLRPNGAILNITGSYANIPQHIIFSGLIEFMDDLEDADKYIFQVQMSDMPQSQPHRARVSKIYSQVNSQMYTSPGSVTSHEILADICSRVGLPFGRCDLPNYRVWGTFEVIRQTVVEVAQRLIGAFNTFDHTRYRVRCDRNGLQIIKIDYMEAGEVANTYALSNIISRQRSFEMYMPENRIGSSDVLCSGADRYGHSGGATIIDANTNEDDLTIDPNKPVVKKETVTHVFTSDSNTTTGYGETKPDIMETWVETESTVEYDIESTFATGAKYAQFQADRLTWAITPDDMNAASEWGKFMDAYAEGQLLNIAIADTRVMKSVQRTYDKVNGLNRKSETHYTYETKAFKKHLWEQNAKDTQVLVSQETTVMSYPSGKEFPLSMERVSYEYDDWGNNHSTISKTYTWARTWKLSTTHVEHNSGQSATNAGIQWEAQEAQYRANEGDRAAERLNAWASQRPKTYGVSYQSPTQSESSSTPIGRYQLLNGLVFSSLPANPITSGLSSGVTTLGSVFVQPQTTRLSNIWDANNNIMANENRGKLAFQMSHDGMDYDGLRLLWALAQQEQDLEKKNPYWEINRVTASIDTSPVAGESIVIGGTSGIVDQVVHHMNGDEALTTVVIRRLIYDA